MSSRIPAGNDFTLKRESASQMSSFIQRSYAYIGIPPHRSANPCSAGWQTTSKLPASYIDPASVSATFFDPEKFDRKL
jgi:hypothetical protein